MTYSENQQRDLDIKSGAALDRQMTRALRQGLRAALPTMNQLARLQWEWNNILCGGYRGQNPESLTANK